MAEQPNVLLMVFDTLRPDYLSCYGKPSSRATPGFDSVAENGTMFKNAFTVGRNTPISHGAMFTGQYPSETGLVGGFSSIPSESTTMAEHFRKHGYETFAISRRSGMLSSDFDHDRGFDEFVEPDKENVIPDIDLDYIKHVFSDPAVLRDSLRTLRSGPDKVTKLKFDMLEKQIRNSDGPFFGFVNQITVHGPYIPPRPYLEKAIPSYERTRFYATELLGDLLGVETRSIDHPNVRSDEIIDGAGFKDHNFDEEGWLSDEEISLLRELYGGLVDYLDYQLREFLEMLSKMGELENTILVLTSDHGEHLGEKEMFGHSHFLFDEVLRVPLAISGPGVPENTRRTDLASLIDVYDTVCDLSGIPAPDSTSGMSLFGQQEREAVFAEYGIRDIDKMGYGDIDGKIRKQLQAGMKCVRTFDHKFVLNSEGDEYLYQVGDSKIEKRDEIVAKLRETLTETLGEEFKKKVEHDEANVNEQSLRNLRKLGYIE